MSNHKINIKEVFYDCRVLMDQSRHLRCLVRNLKFEHNKEYLTARSLVEKTYQLIQEINAP